MPFPIVFTIYGLNRVPIYPPNALSFREAAWRLGPIYKHQERQLESIDSTPYNGVYRGPVMPADDDHDDEEDAGDGDGDEEDDEGRHLRQLEGNEETRPIKV